MYCIVTVENIKVSKITITTTTSNKIATGKKVTLKAAVTPSNAYNKGVTWKSSNTKVATVSSSGVVTTKKKMGGKTVTITATAKDGSGKKASFKMVKQQYKICESFFQRNCNNIQSWKEKIREDHSKSSGWKRKEQDGYN